MGNCALAYFQPDLNKPAEKKGFYEWLRNKFNNSRPKNIAELTLNALFEAEDFCMYAIEIPVKQSSYEDLSKKHLRRINEQIEQICDQKQIKNCYLPQAALSGPESCIKSSFKGDFLFKCLLKELLDSIFTNRGIIIGDINIALIDGESIAELQSFLEILAPYARYISVLTVRRQQVEDMAESLYEEYGLCISISEDYKKGLKDAALIINLGKLEGFISRPRFGKNTVIINYGKLDTSYIPDYVTVINGIEAGLPGIGFRTLLVQPGHYSPNEIAEVLVINKLNLETAPLTLGPELTQAAAKEFNLCGLTIRNLKGSYDTINTYEYKKFQRRPAY